MAFSDAQNQTIKDFVTANFNNPAAIADAAAKFGVTASDLANAVGVTVADVNNYFDKAGLSVSQGTPISSFPERPTPQPSAPEVKSGYTTGGYQPSDYNVSNVLATNEPQAYKDLYSALQSGQARIGTQEVSVGGTYDTPGTIETQYTVFDAKGQPIPGVTVDPNTGTIMLPSAGGFIHVNTQIGPGGALAPVTDYQSQVGYQGGTGGGFRDLAPIIGIAATAFGLPGIIGGALAPTASAATQAALGGAVFGGGMAGFTGQNIGKGALLGGALGYGGSQLGQYLNSGVTDANLLKQAADADMAAGMLPQYGTNAAYDSAMQNLMANSPGAVQQLQNVINPNGAVSTQPIGNTPNQMGSADVMATNQPSNVANTRGYYDEITGKFIPDPNGPLQGPLDNTSGTNLSSMNNYSYDPNTGQWIMPDNTVVKTMLSNQPTTSGGELMSNAAKLGVATGGGGLLSTLTSNPLTTAAAVNAAAGVINAATNKNAINNAMNTQLAAGQQAGSTLKDIYNQQLGFVQPYQQAGLGALNLLGKNQDYLTHQFDATDLAKGLAPNYNFMLQQGQMANQRLANVGGGALSGNALQGLQKFTQDYAGNAYQNAFQNYQTQRQNIYNTLADIAGLGQTANQQAIGAGTGYGQQQTNLATGLAAAQAGAGIGQAQNQANLISNLANNVTLASLLGQKQSVA